MATFGYRVSGPIWELRTVYPWRALILSVAAHVTFCAMFVTLTNDSGTPDAVAEIHRSIPVFTPRPSPAEPPSPSQTVARPIAAPALNAIEAPRETADPAAHVRVDMNLIELSFADDVSNRLPNVVARYAGVLALTEKEDPAFARYVIEPPDWNVRETMLDVSRRVRFAMAPPERWVLLRTIALRNDIRLNRYLACALFDSRYKQCLLEVIRTKAAEKSGSSDVRVQSARLAFNDASPCGVDVLEVSVAPAKP